MATLGPPEGEDGEEVEIELFPQEEAGGQRAREKRTGLTRPKMCFFPLPPVNISFVISFVSFLCLSF